VLSVLVFSRTNFSVIKPVAFVYCYSTWRRERAARRTRVQARAVVTAEVRRLAAMMVAPGDDDESGRLAVSWCPSGGSGTGRVLMAHDAWWCGMPARRSGTKFRLAMWDARQAVLVQWWCVRKVFYTALSDVVMRCFGWGPSYEFNLYWDNTWPL